MDATIIEELSPKAQRVASIREVAARAWSDMQERGVLPSPKNFELWFTHLSGANPALSARLAALLEQDAVPAAEALCGLHAECVAQEIDVDSIADGSEQLDEAARAMVEHVANNAMALHAYGETLSGMAMTLGHERTLEGLIQAVTVLTAETTRAGERNRALEQQLTASAARVAKLRKDLADVKQDATTDSLTGLSNRKAFDSRLRRATAKAKQEGVPMCLVLLDIDYFKRFNDTYGHRTGDLVLRLVGRVIADNVKGRDTAARYGGEEFGVILSGADLRAGEVVAGQMRRALDGKRIITKGGREHYGSVTISAGVAEFRPGDTPASLMERADAALYGAKRKGRNRVCAETDPELQDAA